jgi:small subunit ribosomal protein S17
MADEQDNQTPETPEADAPEAAAEPQDAAPTEEQAPEAETAGQDPATDVEREAPAAELEAVPSEPVERLAPKERRRRKRSAHAGEAHPQRSPEERHAERVEERRKKAVSRRTRRLSERAKAAQRRAAVPESERAEQAKLPPVHAIVEGARRVRQGIVVSDKAEKTITVRIDVARRHRRYEKIVRSSSTVHAHDENNDAHEGDVVRVIESRPLSRTKRWALVDVLERAR